MADEVPIEVRGLTMAFDDVVVMRDLNFRIERGEVFAIMGGSGSGKSTLMRHMIGLLEPASGQVLFEGEDLWAADEAAKKRIRARMGISYQNGALWSGLTVGENVALPMQEYTELDEEAVGRLVSLKLSLVGLAGSEGLYPAELSGGMRKRAALARAMALDPDVLFFDEPSSGLDPVTASRLDDLILQIRDAMGTTVIVVSHDLESIFAIADRAVFLSIEEKTMTALGNPVELRDDPPNEAVHRFLNRRSDAATAATDSEGEGG
jgi:phospholipid/cholesterol/gamma-HCH transport system ATP-binding protein